MDFEIIEHMEKTGVKFCSGLTYDTMARIEEIYDIRFPDSLITFYSTAFPVCVGNVDFPRWNDFSPENIAHIRQLMNAPYQWLRRDIEKGFWLPSWDGKTVEEFEEVNAFEGIRVGYALCGVPFAEGFQYTLIDTFPCWITQIHRSFQP
mgnify:CR=1 FL=1